MVFVTFPLIIGGGIFVGIMTLPGINPLFGVALFFLIFASSYYLGKTACTDPGVLKRYHEKPEGTNWIYSDQAQTFRPRGAIYCSECNLIVEEYDHVCPWTGTGIGKGNMRWFSKFTSFVCCLFVYAIFLVLYKLHAHHDD
jgi:hypothetical protein